MPNPNRTEKRADPSLAETTADSLFQDLQSWPENTLPALGILARRHGVSRCTMWEAAQILKERGVLDFSRGSKIRIAGRTAKEPEQVAPGTSADRMYQTLLEGIRNGTFSAGRPLPKGAFLVAKMGVSQHTVAVAYGRLISEGLARRQGKTVILGQMSPTAKAAIRPTILIVAPWAHFWRSLCTSRRTEDFGRTFVDQARQLNVELVQGILSLEIGKGDYPVPSGREAIKRLIRSLGGGYLGTLAVGKRSHIAGLEPWFSEIGDRTQNRKPFIWLDDLDETFGKKRSSHASIRCHFSEERAVSMALDALCRLGHRRIAYHDRNGSDWSARRLQILKSLADKHTSRPEILELSPHRRSRWMKREEITADLERVRRLKNPRIRSALDIFIKSREMLCLLYAHHSPEVELSGSPYDGLTAFSLAHFKSGRTKSSDPKWLLPADIVWQAIHLAPCLGDESITALVAPNDLLGWSYYRWLRTVGFSIPGRLSLLSFDNYFKFEPYPLATVDFGFGYLGYQAIHAIVQDIPVSKDRSGNIAAEPNLINRGSLGFPN